MNTKIFDFLMRNLEKSFALKKYGDLIKNLGPNVYITDLPWTPVRWEKFQRLVGRTIAEVDLDCTIYEAMQRLDRAYLHKFFGQVWRPRTKDYFYTGQCLADAVNEWEPSSVLDVGCGYNEFKSKIPNLTGIDPYNNAADYMVDLLEFETKNKYDAIIALGSINFGTAADIEKAFAKCIALLADNGRFYLRCNPGLQHKDGPWVEIFQWTFGVANAFAEKYDLVLESFKTDLDRLYIVYHKPYRPGI